MNVLLPFHPGDSEQARDLLTWIGELDPPWPKHQIVALASAEVGKDFIVGLRHHFTAVPVYQQQRATRIGWPGGPNAMFACSENVLKSEKADVFLWLEPDCVPMRPGWLDAIEAEYRKAGKPFMGTRIDWHALGNDVPHLNGVAVYSMDAIRKSNPAMLSAGVRLAFDVTSPSVVLSQAHVTPLIQRLLQNPPHSRDGLTFPDAASVAAVSREAVLFHGCRDGSLIERLREAKAGPVPKATPKPKSRRFISSAIYRAWGGVSALLQSRATPSVLESVRIYHAVERHGVSDERKLRAQASWDRLYWQGVLPCHLWERDYPRTAREIGDARALPYLKDVLAFAMRQAGERDIILWTNDDNWLHPELTELLLAHVCEHGPCTSKRCEIARPIPDYVAEPSSYTQGAIPHLGRDVFAAPKKWLRDNWQEFPDFILGASDFDLCLAAMVRLSHGFETTYGNLYDVLPPSELPYGYVVHERHAPRWAAPDNQDTSPSQLHNRRLFHEWAKKKLPALAFRPNGVIFDPTKEEKS